MSLLSRCAFLFAFISVSAAAQTKLKTPAEFLGYELGDRFTSHHRVVDYFNYVASTVSNARVHTYGETYEKRPLIYLVITSPENFQRLDDIRLDNLRRARLESGEPTGKKMAIVWLSYNVHGNEASSTEAAMLTLYNLADANNSKARQWLSNTVVVIDPCMNPDGRDRYANFNRQFGSYPPNPRPDAIEHRESWPSGRTNHYMFDLNRDWAWCTQIESQQRIKAYNDWMPHVHVDFHEQGYNNPYFFAPAAEPLHEVVTPWQRDFQLIIGKNNAKYFDEKGWLYFTKEVFDLYYPSYGDTYPTYNGAIGMTYEQGGGGAGALVVTTETGQPLTLKERIEHHYTSGLATIEISSQNAERLADNFQKYFRDNETSPTSEYKTYLVKASNDPVKVKQLADWLNTHKVRFGHPSGTRGLRGYNFQTQTTTAAAIEPQDLVFNIYQPKSRFLTTIFEPTSRLSDSLTYDITAWNLMYSYNLEAFAFKERVDFEKPFSPKAAVAGEIADRPYAYVLRYNNLKDASLLAALLEKGVKVRCAEKPFSQDGQSFPEGTLVISRVNNEDLDDFDQLVTELAAEHGRIVHTAKSGFVDQGKDLGSAELRLLNQPEIAILGGDQVTPMSFGEVWHFFERQIGYPVTPLRGDYFNANLLRRYNVLIIPDGSYKMIDDARLEELASWVRSGGRLIIMGSALESFVDRKGFGLKRYATDSEKARAEQAAKTGPLPKYKELQREFISNNIFGAIYKATLDNSHPLAFGMKTHYYTLKTDDKRYAWLQNGWNVGYLGQSPKPIQGFAGYKANQALTNSLVIGVEHLGAGQVIYFVDNPLFRSFWEEGKMLFANAVFVCGN